MATTLEWFGTATFHVRDAGLDLFFDAYLDRLLGLEPVGLSTAEVEKADFVFVSHAHFDHLYGAEPRGTAGARRRCHRCRLPRVGALPACLRRAREPAPRRHRRRNGPLRPDHEGVGAAHAPPRACSPTASPTRRSPASATSTSAHSDAPRRWRGSSAPWTAAPAPARPAVVESNERCSRHDGGQLAYLLTTAGGSMLVSGSAGYWRGIFDGLRPDVALLSVGGRPNVDGEPFQGPAVRYMLEQVQLLRPGQVAFCHHDPLFPGLPGVDVAPAAAALRDPTVPAGYFEMEYATPAPALRLTRSGARCRGVIAPTLVGPAALRCCRSVASCPFGGGKRTLSSVGRASSPALWLDGRGGGHQAGPARHRRHAFRRQCLRDLRVEIREGWGDILYVTIFGGHIPMATAGSSGRPSSRPSPRRHNVRLETTA